MNRAEAFDKGIFEFGREPFVIRPDSVLRQVDRFAGNDIKGTREAVSQWRKSSALSVMPRSYTESIAKPRGVSV